MNLPIGGDPAEQYVTAQLVLTARKTYPQHPPVICLQDAKGVLRTSPPLWPSKPKRLTL